MFSRIFLTLALLFTTASLHAVAIVPYPSGSTFYNTNDTISSSLSSWSSGWGAGNTHDGWDYVGQVGGASDASGVYLGNGWVITAGHVGALDFTLGTNTYATTGYSYTNFTITNAGTTYHADLNLFKVSTISTLGNALLPTNNLTIIPSYSGTGQTLAMIGYGDAAAGRQKSWGINTVTVNNLLVTLTNTPYTSVDFGTHYGTNSLGTTNSAQVIVGDSGGGDFIKNGNSWYLAGLNEAVNNGDSYLVNLGYYSSQITSVMNSVPEPSSCVLMGLGSLIFGSAFWRSRQKSS